MFKQFSDDLKSSIVVFLVALPLCLGIALASNAPLSSGIISGIVGGVVVGFLSNSPISVSGPAAGLTVIVASGIASLGDFQLLTFAVLIAGVIQILLGLMKAGQIGDYFPSATIKGMLAAIGLILIIKQIPNALGVSYQDFSFNNVDTGVVIISVLSLGIMILWDRFSHQGVSLFKFVPGALVAVLLSVFFNHFFSLVSSGKLVSIPNDLFRPLTEFKFDQLGLLLQVSFTLAVVASLETLLCIDAADRLDERKRKTNKDRELIAQGVGNIISGILGGLPITAVIVRTSANVNAGAKSKLSAIFHGLWLLICVLLIPGFLSLIPLATLACILLLVGYKLTKPAFYFEMYKKGLDQLFLFTVTILSILFTDLLKGIFIGLIFSLIFEVKRIRYKVITQEVRDQKLVIKFISAPSFFHRPQILKAINSINTDVRTVVFDNSKKFDINLDVKDFLRDQKQDLEAKKYEVVFL
jgi:MFS superfamily sulfate permease-like transporter